MAVNVSELEVKAEDIMKKIEAGEADRDDLLKLLEELQAAEADLKSDRDALQKDRDALLEDAGIDPRECYAEMNEQGRTDLQEMVFKYDEDMSEIEIDRGGLIKIREDVEKYLDTIKYFDKATCFANIRNLLKESDVKIGQIEKAAGVRLGYMSRLEKPENTSEPTIQFVATAAKLLGVSLDELLYTKTGEITDAEKYVREFLRDVLEDTKEHKIHWEKERSDILGKPHNLYENGIDHPLLAVDDTNLDSDGTPYLLVYASKFFKESSVYPKDGTYYATLPNSDSKLYLVWCFTNDDDLYIPDKVFFEVYLIDGEGVANPICNTLKTGNVFGILVNELYKMAMSDAAQVYINDSTKGIIDHYRSRRKPV